MIVSVKAIEGRVRRKLAREGFALHKTREGSRALFELGEFFIADADTGTAIQANCDLEELARELEVMRDVEMFQ